MCAGTLGVHPPSFQRAEDVEQFEALEKQYADHFLRRHLLVALLPK